MVSTLRLEWEDRLRYSRGVRFVLAAWKAARAGQPPADAPQAIARTIHQLCQAARLAGSEAQQWRIEAKILAQVKRLGGRKIDWREFEPTADKRVLENAAILKPYIHEREKGVIYVSFEYQWPRLLQAGAVNELAQQYRLVLGPVWADPYGLVNYVLPALWPDQVFCHLSDPRDARILPRMAPNYVVVPLYCSSWVNPAWYQPVPFDQKDIDLVMLANFGKYKRHFALFRALRDLPRSTRVVLMGQRHGARTREVLLSEARAYGVADRFELWENAPDADVFRAMARAKTSVILSRREGSCIAVVESLLADTPVAVLAGAEVGSRVFINEQTGRFLAARNLGAQLREFIAQAHCYHPRRWAMDHQIHCQGSSAVLNRVVKETCLAAGEAWTCDLAPFQWRPEPQLLAPADRARLQPARAAVQARFGVQIGKEPPAGG